MSFWHTMIEVFPRFMPVLLEGAGIAVQVAAGALLVVLAGGLILALATLSRFRPLRLAARAYIELIRGTPALTGAATSTSVNWASGPGTRSLMLAWPPLITIATSSTLLTLKLGRWLGG